MKKRTIILLLASMLFIGCSTAYKTETEAFIGMEYVKSFSYKIKLPEGYKRLYMTSGEGGHDTYQYKYPKGMLFYVAERIMTIIIALVILM